MNLNKILGLIGIALAIIGAFVASPYIATALVIIGLIVGFSIAADTHVRVIVSAIALSSLAGVLTSIPGVGQYLTAIVANLGVMAAGAAITVILCNIYGRFKP
ncbi:MAG TPA: hypothetical protein VF848_01550 [Steroidobacteraceae bacterium]